MIDNNHNYTTNDEDNERKKRRRTLKKIHLPKIRDLPQSFEMKMCAYAKNGRNVVPTKTLDCYGESIVDLRVTTETSHTAVLIILLLWFSPTIFFDSVHR
jgi:hypothetical protein